LLSVVKAIVTLEVTVVVAAVGAVTVTFADDGVGLLGCDGCDVLVSDVEVDLGSLSATAAVTSVLAEKS